MPSCAILTQNCFGVPAPLTGRRLQTLARELNQRDALIVGLQEVQAHFYRDLLVRACVSFPFAASEPFVHAPKGGLLTLSRLPIERFAFVPYRWRAVAAPPAVMDWLLYKGVLITRHTLAGVPVTVLNTHLNANYSGDWSEANRYVRAEREQLRELAELVVAEPRDTLVVVLGDFNIPRGSWLYQEFLEASGLTDPLAGDTRSTYRVHSGIPERYALPIDFALLRPLDLPGFSTQSDLCFTERVPLIGGRPEFLSDHYGVELRISWEPAGSGSEEPSHTGQHAGDVIQPA